MRNITHNSLLMRGAAAQQLATIEYDTYTRTLSAVLHKCGSWGLGYDYTQQETQCDCAP